MDYKYDFKEGDIVECINDADSACRLTTGRKYKVSRSIQSNRSRDKIYLTHDNRIDKKDIPWYVHRFKLYKACDYSIF